MPRRLRIEFEGEIYHVMTRGNARQDLVHDDDDRRRLLDDLERAVTRQGCLSQPAVSPFREGFGGWVLGSDRFVARLRALAGPLGPEPSTAEARHLAGQSVEAICAGVAAHYGLESSDWMRLRAGVEPRSVAAWLCRRYTEAPLRELAGRLVCPARAASRS
jgi:hypothetical protein